MLPPYHRIKVLNSTGQDLAATTGIVLKSAVSGGSYASTLTHAAVTDGNYATFTEFDNRVLRVDSVHYTLTIVGHASASGTCTVYVEFSADNVTWPTAGQGQVIDIPTIGNAETKSISFEVRDDMAAALLYTANAMTQAEDSAHSSAHDGVMMLGVRTDTPVARSGNDGDYEPLQLVNGALTQSGLRQVGSAITLLASGSRTADGVEADVTSALLSGARGLLLVCDVTAQSGTTPTLDVAIQAKFGSQYTNLARFSQYLGATGTKAINLKRDLSFATEITLEADPAVSTGLLVNNHDWGSILRVKYAIGGTTPDFTFSVVAYPIR